MIDPFTGSLIAGGLSAVGGLFGASDAKAANSKQREVDNGIAATNLFWVTHANERNEVLGAELHNIPENTLTKTQYSVDIDGMMRAAEASGFNPVTYLRAGGLAAHATTLSDVTRTGHNAVAAQQLRSPTIFQRGPNTPSIPVQGLGSILSNAAGAGFGYYADAQQRLSDQAFQRSLLQMQLASRGGTSGAAGRAIGGISAASPQGQNLLRAVEPQPGTLTAPTQARWYNVDPTRRNTEDGTQSLGELWDWIGVVPNLTNDLIYSATGVTRLEREDWTIGHLNSLRGAWESFRGGLLRSPPPPVTGGAFPSPNSYGIGGW